MKHYLDCRHCIKFADSCKPIGGKRCSNYVAKDLWKNGSYAPPEGGNYLYTEDPRAEIGIGSMSFHATVGDQYKSFSDLEDAQKWCEEKRHQPHQKDEDYWECSCCHGRWSRPIFESKPLQEEFDAIDVCTTCCQLELAKARVAELEAALAWHPASAPPDSSRQVVGYCTDGYLRLVNYENPTWNCTPYGFADVVEWCEIPLRMKDTP